MTEKEIAEIRRRLKPDKCNITTVRGCYVNDQRQIVSQFNQSIALMPEEEAEEMLALLKKTLSGTLGKNLVDLPFSTQQVVESEEHQLLMAMRTTSLEDEEAVQAFFKKVIDAVHLEEHYLILLASDRYDVPYRSKDGMRQDDASGEVFHYFLCSICPVKEPKPALGYQVFDNTFRTCRPEGVIGAPAFGFLFPAFDDRGANIYSALYCTRDSSQMQDAFLEAVFHSEIPMPAATQKEAFQSILEGTLAEDCSYEVVQAVHGQLGGMIEEHKTNKEEQPLVFSKGTVKRVLESCGVSEEHVQAFESEYDTAFGADVSLSARNIVDSATFEVRTPDVTVRVKPECSSLVETRVIDGAKYILIRVSEGVEVNGVNVRL